MSERAPVILEEQRMLKRKGRLTRFESTRSRVAAGSGVHVGFGDTEEDRGDSRAMVVLTCTRKG